MMADKDEEWDKSLEGKSEWINRPAQPPGLLRTGRQDSSLKELDSHAAGPSIVVLQVRPALVSCSSNLESGRA